jgi:hypothetical protein
VKKELVPGLSKNPTPFVESTLPFKPNALIYMVLFLTLKACG